MLPHDSLEIIVGYSVGSLALVADSFHMLNDVMSLIVALYALNVSHGRLEEASRRLVCARSKEKG